MSHVLGHYRNIVDINWYSHAGSEQREPEAARDFLREALQERLENEAATSLLIAEITDMKSRLDDLLAKPLTGHTEGRENNELEKDLKDSDSVSEQNHKENESAHLEGVADETLNQDNRVTKLLVHQRFAIDYQTSQETDFWSQSDRAPGVLKLNEVSSHANTDSCEDAIACEQGTISTGKRLRCHPEGSSFQQKNSEERISSNMKVCFAKNSKLDMHIFEESQFNQLGLSHHDVHKECCILQRMLLESCEQETQRDTFSLKDDDMHTTMPSTKMLAECQPLGDHPVQTARVSKPTCLQAASDLSLRFQAAPLKQQGGLRKCEDAVLFCFKKRRDATKLLDAEKSLLASLERLDMKLAMNSASIQSSSRTSLVSAGHQSTKSAPCMSRQKPGSDAYSVNSTMFLSRPTTSQAARTSLFSKRRQNIGVTNVSKDRLNHPRTCNLQHIKRPPLLSESQRKDRTTGTIIVHQNAEFLFN